MYFRKKFHAIKILFKILKYLYSALVTVPPNPILFRITEKTKVEQTKFKQNIELKAKPSRAEPSQTKTAGTTAYTKQLTNTQEKKKGLGFHFPPSSHIVPNTLSLYKYIYTYILSHYID